MVEPDLEKQYTPRRRILSGIGSLLIVLGTIHVINLERRLPFDFYGMIAVMIVCAVFLVHVFGHIAITGSRPRYLRRKEKN